jgi:predicted nuclease of restriction endonuclease-like RecB superfamily
VLRGEHVIARLYRGRLQPHSLSPSDGRTLETAKALCRLYGEHLGYPRRELEWAVSSAEEELGTSLDPRRGFKVVRALAKLLDERAEWSEAATSDPYTLRTRIFDLAAALPEPPASEPGLLGSPTRDDILSQVARETDLEDPASAMFADRQGAQVLEVFDRPEPEELIDRYNVAQIQALLYSASALTVDLGAGADARLIFHYVKLLGLVYSLETLEEVEGGYRITLDGPLSIFGGTRKYGLRLAKLLPGLLLTSPWSLSATVAWKGRKADLALDSEGSGLRGHYRSPKDLEPEDGGVHEAFERAWERAKDTGDWELGRTPGIIPFPERRTALVPDFTLRDARTGQAAHLEILGFWTESQLVERAAMIRAARDRGHRLLVAASDRLGPSRETLEEAAGGEIIPFKNRLDPRDVLAKLAALRDNG